MRKPPYRTLAVAMVGIFSLGVGLWLTGVYQSAAGGYGTFATGVTGIVASVALKAYGEHREDSRKSP
jgi:hypothetical protein